MERFSGFSADYEKFRPIPPESIFKLALKLSGLQKAELVVDLGCGTGLSTRPWSNYSKRVLGIDSSLDMLDVARKHTSADNISYVLGFGEKTGLEDKSVDILACSSSMHWMEPYSLVTEIERILKSYGIFLIYGHYYPVYADSFKLTMLHEKWRSNLDRLEYLIEKRNLNTYKLEKSLEILSNSGVFTYTRKHYMHSEQLWTSEHIIGFMEAHAGVPFLRTKGYGDEKLLFTEIKQTLSEFCKDFRFTVYFTYSIYFGIKK